MFSKTLIALLFVLVSSYQAYAQNPYWNTGPQMVGDSMSNFLNYAKGGGGMPNQYNKVQYQYLPIYSSVYDPDGREYIHIQKERSMIIDVMRWLRIDPKETELFSYYRNDIKKD